MYIIQNVLHVNNVITGKLCLPHNNTLCCVKIKKQLYFFYNLLRFCVGDRFYLCENKILCEYDYEERLVFANIAYNPSSLAHIRRQVSNLQVWVVQKKFTLSSNHYTVLYCIFILHQSANIISSILYFTLKQNKMTKFFF